MNDRKEMIDDLIKETVELEIFNEWLKEWKDLLAYIHINDSLPSKKIKRSIELFNVLGNGYSFDRIRQRLLLSSELVELITSTHGLVVNLSKR